MQIKNVPEETHVVLRRWAAAAHQSLQEYLCSRLVAEAARPTVAEVFERIERERSGGSAKPEDVVAVLREDRDRH